MDGAGDTHLPAVRSVFSGYCEAWPYVCVSNDWLYNIYRGNELARKGCWDGLRL